MTATLGLATDAASDPGALSQAFVGIVGSAYGDWLGGSAGNDLLDGQSGDDILAGGAGADMLAGGTGSDWADYGHASGGITVDLATSSGTRGDASGDRLNSIENVAGSAFDDHIFGDHHDNILVGAAGNDVLRLGAGNDTLMFAFGDGIDTILDFGGDGMDIIALAGFVDIHSFAQLVDQQRLVTVDGFASIILGESDRIVLANVADHAMPTASHFKF